MELNGEFLTLTCHIKYERQLVFGTLKLGEKTGAMNNDEKHQSERLLSCWWTVFTAHVTILHASLETCYYFRQIPVLTAATGTLVFRDAILTDGGYDAE
jgi:hypothetical protein